MGYIEDYYRNFELEQTLRHGKARVDEHNRNVDIIKEVIAEILNATKSRLPDMHHWTVIEADPSREKTQIGWIIESRHDGYYERHLCVLSDGRICENVRNAGILNINFIELEHTKSSPSSTHESLRNRVIDLAVKDFKIEAKDSWGYKPQPGYNPKSQGQITNDLLKEILEVLKGLQTNTTHPDD